MANTAKDIVGPTNARLELDLDPDVVVPASCAHALPKIVREAVFNAIEHGRARTVTVHLRDADGIWLRVTEDGDGFDPFQPSPEPRLGLINIRERTEWAADSSFRPPGAASLEIQVP